MGVSEKMGGRKIKEIGGSSKGMYVRIIANKEVICYASDNKIFFSVSESF